MLIRKLDRDAFVNAYNVDLQLLYPWEGVVQPPFGAAWAVLAPGQSTKPHAHQECETFFIAGGRGVMAIGDDRVEVEPGHVTFHRPFDNHVLTNTSDSEELLFLTVWWEERARWSAGDGRAVPADEAQAAGPWAGVERVLVTAAPPTPNGDLHLGHLAGPYLGADFCARALRLCGLDARFACGSDDNSIYVQAKGRELGWTAEEAARRFTDGIEETLAAAGIGLATFPRPNASPHHRPLVQDFFRALHERGELVEKDAPAPWCEGCDRYLFESAIRGGCPHCGAGVVGNTCEDCGTVFDAAALVDPLCTACGETPGQRPVRRLFFPLSRWRDELAEYYRHVEMSPHLRSLCERVLADGAPDVAVTHPCDWGIPVPVPGYEDQRIYVWLEMAPRYLAYARHVEEAAPGQGGGEGGGVSNGGASNGGWQRWWKSPESRVVQFFGFDNSFYYGCLIPALLRAYDREIRLPAAFVTNEFYRLDGEKFSTSRDHRILGRDLLAEAPRDAVRFFLAHTAPEREETNFTREEFRATLSRELAGAWQDWLAGLGRRAAAAGGTVPSTGDWTPEQRRFYHRLEALLGEAGEAYDPASFSPQRATRAMAELVREARRFGSGERHWEQAEARGEERRTALALELLAARLLGLIAAPVMPELADRLWRALGYPEGPGAGAWNDALEWLPSGQPVDLAGLGADGLIPGLAESLAGTEAAAA